jgi:hypothetical protein
VGQSSSPESSSVSASQYLTSFLWNTGASSKPGESIPRLRSILNPLGFPNKMLRVQRLERMLQQ